MPQRHTQRILSDGFVILSEAKNLKPMESSDLLRRLEDLCRRCEKANLPTATPFLSPAEQAQAAAWLKTPHDCAAVFFGGDAACERRVLFFLPDWQPQPAPDAVCAVRFTAHFGSPGHRDYLGAMLALGVRREWLGDLRVDGQTAWVFCLPSVAGQLASLTRVGSVSVSAAQIPPAEVPAPVYRCKELSFTVQSARLDAVLSEVFSISRTLAAQQIKAGSARLNDLPCLKPDAPIREGDVLSLRGAGKGKIVSIGGQSRKGRTYVHAERYL